MQPAITANFLLTIGRDLGSANTQCAVYGTCGNRLEERNVTTNREQCIVLLRPGAGA